MAEQQAGISAACRNVRIEPVCPALILSPRYYRAGCRVSLTTVRFIHIFFWKMYYLLRTNVRIFFSMNFYLPYCPECLNS